MELSGTQISEIRTIPSKYNNNSVIIVLDDGRRYMMKCEELLRMVNLFRFSTNKKRVHTYIEVLDPIVNVEELVFNEGD